MMFKRLRLSSWSSRRIYDDDAKRRALFCNEDRVVRSNYRFAWWPCSEELRFHESTTGAHNDFERATKIARAMVTEYGMSDLGPIQLEQQRRWRILRP